MLKLYKFNFDSKEYWETWDNEDGSHTIHWGILGTEGQNKEVKNSLFKKAEIKIQKEIDEMLSLGFVQVEDESTLLIEFSVDGMGTESDLIKRHNLEEKMNEVLGWTGLGNCDGGSIGSGTMEVCNLVVDYDVAKKVIEKALQNTEFENYTRIYCEEAE